MNSYSKKPERFARDSKRLIVDDDNMKHKDLFGDIFPMCVVFLLLSGGLVYVAIRAFQMLFL